ncbi:3-deoxy-7-phosphoheptulonate synthase, partial [Streptosporangium algeriense]
MVIVMGPDATQGDIEAIVEIIGTAGGDAFVSRGVSRTIIGLVGDVEQFGSLNLKGMRGVAEVMRVTAPYKLVSRDNHPERSTVRVGGVPIGPGLVTLIAGPCAVETPQQTLDAALMAWYS